MKQKIVRALAFIARCSAAATAAYELASLLGLTGSVWAAMSAVIVSQERLHETHSSIRGRILGTLLGIAVTIVVNEVASRAAAAVALQMAISVAICALIAREFPALRVAMWTCPIVLLAVQPSVPIVVVALYRGSEVILGALVGWVFHWVAETLVDAVIGTTPGHQESSRTYGWLKRLIGTRRIEG
ncbi:putative membrane protein [Rhizobium sp. CF122]|uniref:FUSC family protein n=1 Tax=Rhizobium sp. CF122 TaxID=1144312 RepID=UPI0002718FC9|nr:FUSC family protein [Rhizobium sp. CF122]EJL50721.1 putative membrane protein [Rhizobium sp. CF122]